MAGHHLSKFTSSSPIPQLVLHAVDRSDYGNSGLAPSTAAGDTVSSYVCLLILTVDNKVPVPFAFECRSCSDDQIRN